MTTKETSYPVINFMKYKFVYFIISACVILPGLYFIVSSGLKPGIDFSGGSILELQLSPEANLTQQQISQAAESQGIQVASIQTTDTKSFILRTEAISRDQSVSLQQLLATSSASLSSSESAQAIATSAATIQEIQFATIGPTLGRELLQKTLYSIVLAIIAILIYIAWRFKDIKFGVTAIIAMLHDTLILVGVFAILGQYMGVEIDTLFVTAVLTTLSFSVHDTIVVYDRIRESQARYPLANFTDLVNKSIAETLSRSINNSMTIIFMLLALWLMGGETTRWFVFALLIGTIAGTYSSTFTAAPLLDLWHSLAAKKSSPKKKK